jgi:hypothetical protein
VAPVGTSSDGPVVGGSTPSSGTNSTAAPSACGDGGTGSHLSGMARPPSLFSSSSDEEFANASGGESPYCSCNRYSSLYCSKSSRRLILLSFACATRSCSHYCATRPTTRARGVGGSDCAALTTTNCGQRMLGQATRRHKESKENERPRSPADRRGASQTTRGRRRCAARLEANRAPLPRGRVFLGEALLQQPRVHRRQGLAASLISKMQS